MAAGVGRASLLCVRCGAFCWRMVAGRCGIGLPACFCASGVCSRVPGARFRVLLGGERAGVGGAGARGELPGKRAGRVGAGPAVRAAHGQLEQEDLNAVLRADAGELKAGLVAGGAVEFSQGFSP
jgi:hypothetical protein